MSTWHPNSRDFVPDYVEFPKILGTAWCLRFLQNGPFGKNSKQHVEAHRVDILQQLDEYTEVHIGSGAMFYGYELWDEEYGFHVYASKEELAEAVMLLMLSENLEVVNRHTLC